MVKNMPANKKTSNIFWTLIENQTVHFIIVFCLPVLLYLQTLGFSLSYADDDDILINNFSFISKLSNAPQVFLNDAFLEKSTPLYRPLQTLSYMTDIWLSGGNNTWMYHLTNILLLGLSACLLFLLLKKISVPLHLALLSTLVYYSHPLFISSIAWIPARGELLLSIFSLLSFLFLIEYMQNVKTIYLIYNWLCFTIALFCKETAAILPVIFIIYYFLFSNKMSRKNIAYGLLTILLYSFSGILWFWLRSIAIGNASNGNHVGLLPFFSNLRTIPESLASFFIPVNIELIPSFSFSKTIIGIGVIILISLVFRNKEFRKEKVFWCLWFFLLLLPSLFFKTDFIDYLNHRFFLPLIGMLLFTIVSIPRNWLIEKAGKITFLLVIIIACQSYVTYSKSLAYSDPLTYCNTCVLENPNNALMYNNRGYIKDKVGDLQGAISDYTKAIELKPDLALIYYNRANVYGDVGDLIKAINDYDKAIELDPGNPGFYYNRGNLYQVKSKLTEAINNYNKAIELDPNYLFAYNNRGLAYNTQGNPEKAIRDFNKVLELDPNYSVAYSNRGLAYSALGKSELAIKNYNRAIELDPYFADAYYNRAIEFKNKGMLREAGRDLEAYDNLIKNYSLKN